MYEVHHRYNKYKDRTISAWGDNNYGQLSYAISSNHSILPVIITIPKLAVNEFILDIAAGITHTIVLTSKYRIFGWGSEANRLKRHKKTIPELISLTVLDREEHPVMIGAGYKFSVAITNFGRVITWGCNDFGQLGHNSDIPNFVPIEDVIDIAVGWHHVLARTNNKIYSWGRGTEGQLGNGGNSNSSTPVVVDTTEKVIAIGAGGNFSAFINEECGHVYTWGANEDGQLAVGYTGGFCYYPQVTCGNHIQEHIMYIACGASHLLLATDKTVYSYGNNNFGQLNLPNTASVLDILAGVNYSVIVGIEPSRTETTLFIAGDNKYGLLGKPNKYCKYNMLRQSKHIILIAAGGATLYILHQ